MKYILFFLLLFSQLTYAADAEQLAEAETGAWKSYYAKDELTLIRSLLKMISLQFPNQNQKDLDIIAYKFNMAILEFGALPHQTTTQSEYEKKILPSLIDGYQTLKKATGAAWDPKKVAELDLAWWIARRQPESKSDEHVGKIIAQYYSAIYGNRDDSHFERAAFLRAAAARYRDLCTLWNRVTDSDWQIVQTLLKASYTELLLGIKATAANGQIPVH